MVTLTLAAAHKSGALDAGTALAIFGAIATAIVALFVGLLNYRAQNRIVVTTRFGQATAQLGKKNPDVRVGAIYALEQIMKTSRPERRAIIELLASYVLAHAPYPTDEPIRDGQPPPGVPEGERPLRGWARDVQAAMSVLGRRPRTTLRERLRGDRTDPLGAAYAAAAVNVSGADLRVCDLAKADFARTRMYQCKLQRAVLFRADLSKANLAETILDKADLQKAALRSTNLVAASLRGADLRGSDLHWADLRKADVRTADLRGADLYGADLRDARLEGAKLSGAKNLGDADLRGSDLRGTDLFEADLRGVDLRGVNLRELDLREADLRGLDLRGADLGGVDLFGAGLRDARLEGTNLSNAKNLSDADLRGAMADSHTSWPPGFDPQDRGVVERRTAQQGAEARSFPAPS